MTCHECLELRAAFVDAVIARDAARLVTTAKAAVKHVTRKKPAKAHERPKDEPETD